MSMFGYGDSRFDAGLSSKVDQLLAGTKSAKDKVDEFLVEDLGVDPTTLPLSLFEAQKLLNTQLNNRSAQHMDLIGTSQGLARVEFTPEEDSQGPQQCPSCGDYDIDQHDASTHEWECQECNNRFVWKPVKSGTVVVKAGDSGKDAKDNWHEWSRIHAALVKHVHSTADGKPHEPRQRHSRGLESAGHDDEGASDHGQFTKFRASKTWGQSAEITPIKDQAPKWKKAAKYPTGTVLRVQLGDQLEYVRIGGLFSDEDVTILATMQPMKNPSAWTVVEVLDQ